MSYFYHQQFKKHIVQFMEIFRGTEIKTGISADGSIKTIEVPIMYGSIDRVAASIAAKNTQNLPLRLPVMSAYLSNIALDPSQFVGIDTERDVAYTPRGGVFPTDTRTISTVKPIPVNLSMDLHIYTSNIDNMLQILEQTLILFNPSLQIQTSDNLYDGGKITRATLMSITNNENFPTGTDRRTIMYTLTFDVTCYLTAPSKIKNDRIQSIKLRIGQLNESAIDGFEEIEELDFTVTETIS